MARKILLAFSLLCVTSLPATAEPGQDSYMIRMLACEGPDAKMEIYIPQSAAFDDKGVKHALAQPVIGSYALDLTNANKGKVLEPVKVSMSADGTTVTVNQYTRGLPPTRIPVAGGTVDFDQRFGTGARCGPFQSQE